MKRLIVCCDGTWNTPEDEEYNLPSPTNVIRIRNALAPRDAEGNEQGVYYHTGVGTDGGFFARLAGGFYGAGLEQNIVSAYTWLSGHYEATDTEQDQIYLFGFSRGAYTVRCLADMIGLCGLPDIDGVPSADDWALVRQTYRDGYLPHPEPGAWQPPSGRKWRKPGDVRIHFVGVWDTVGALGIPDNFALLNFFDRSKHRCFPDLMLGSHVDLGRHAVAIDESRAVFSPSLWRDTNDRPIVEDERIKQLWFPGVHADVGGGYSATGLSDIALDWMFDEAAAAGLAFIPGIRNQTAPNPQGVLHQSVKGGFRLMRTQPRSVPRFSPAEHALHPSAWQRHRCPSIAQAPYHKTLQLTRAGQKLDCPVYASKQWNNTGIYLEAGVQYVLTGAGRWIDHRIVRDPSGADVGPLRIGKLLGLVRWLAESAQWIYRALSRNPYAQFPFTRRDGGARWFSLAGIVANGGNPAADGTAAPHQRLPIGEKLTVAVKEPGYLYVFANGTWHIPDSFRGSVILSVERL